LKGASTEIVLAFLANKYIMRFREFSEAVGDHYLYHGTSPRNASKILYMNLLVGRTKQMFAGWRGRFKEKDIDTTTFSTGFARTEIEYCKKKIKEMYILGFMYTLGDIVSYVKNTYTEERRDLFDDFLRCQKKYEKHLFLF
jgi:hypothetical protein